MPFYCKNSPVSELIFQAKKMYSNENVRLLNLRGNFRIGLQSIVQTILKKMPHRQYEQCEAEFMDPVHSQMHLLYFAEVANQLATDSKTANEFDWLCKSACYYSAFLNNHVLKETSYSEEIKNHLMLIINQVIVINIDKMLAIDHSKAQCMLSVFIENDYFCHFLHKAIRLKNEAMRTIASPPASPPAYPPAYPSAYPSASTLPTLHVSGERSILSFFNKPAVPLPDERPPQHSFTHNPYMR